MTNTQYLISFWVVVLLALAGFYYVEIRPSQIRSDCFNDSVNSDIIAYKELSGNALTVQEQKDYRACLNEHGLVQ